MNYSLYVTILLRCERDVYTNISVPELFPRFMFVLNNLNAYYR